MQLDYKNLHLAYLSGANNVFNYSKTIDKLNIFPVPDGDTGTNMMLTLTKTMKEFETDVPDSITDFCEKFNEKIVMSARGNSGVILSQIMTGMHKYLITQKLKTVSAFHLKKSFAFGKEYAYQAVMNPVEGTILTIIREISDKTRNITHLKPISISDFMDEVTRIADISLKNTPNLLPVLKETGVVDSGAFGLVIFLQGIHHYLKTEKIITRRKSVVDKNDALIKNMRLSSQHHEYGYCTETIIAIDTKLWNDNENLNQIKRILHEQGGTSIVTALASKILKIHVHILQVGHVLTYLQQFGEFEHVKIENMTLQSKKHKLSFKGQLTFKHELVFIPIVPSYELQRYFNIELNIEQSVVAGRLMNPTAEDLLDVFKQADASEIVLLPNNKNTFMVAEQAADLEPNSTIRILKTTSVADAVSIIINYDPSKDFKKNLPQIKNNLKKLVVLKITQSEKEVKVNNVLCKIGDFILMHNHKIIYAYSDFKILFKKQIDNFINKFSEMITIFISEKGNIQHLNFIKKILDDDYNLEYEIISSGDMIYQFIISIE